MKDALKKYQTAKAAYLGFLAKTQQGTGGTLTANEQTRKDALRADMIEAYDAFHAAQYWEGEKRAG